MSSLWPQLTAKSKLDRDRGVAQMNQLFSDIQEEVGAHEIEIERQLISDQLAAFFALHQSVSSSWETKLGALLGANVLFSGPIPGVVAHLSEVPFVTVSLDLLVDPEVRVRTAAAELLGTLARARGEPVYERAKDQVLGLIGDNIVREQKEQTKEVEENIRRSSEDIFHDTAGWKNLETSMLSLRLMVEGLGAKFQAHLNTQMIEVISQSLKHTNRFVRETGYQTLASFVKIQGTAEASDKNMDYGKLFAEAIAFGLADNWSQVRLAASVTCREFLCAFSHQQEAYYPLLLPRICLNRYYMAEGVKLYNQETWRNAFGANGRAFVTEYLSSVVDYYVSCTQADNHAVREAACHCIAELAVKIDVDALQPFVAHMLTTLVECFKDDSWPVRDAACVAAGRFVKQFPEESRMKSEELFTLFQENLKDPISSVRQGAAQAIANLVLAYKEDEDLGYFPKCIDLLRDGLLGIKGQPNESYRYSDLSKEVTTFGVAKRVRDNDPELHENQVMFSCGSLAPKMGRGGCTDARFKKPSEPWELSDGCVHLFAELCVILPQTQFQTRLHPLLAVISDTLHVRHFTLHLNYAESVWKRLPEMANSLGKRNFKPYLEEFMPSLFYAADSENALARAAAENSIEFLSKYLGPRILYARVEMLDPNLLPVLERSISGPKQPGEDDGIPVGIPMPPGGRRATSDSGMPMLGGTPP